MATPVRLDIGSTIDASFNVVRRNPRATLLPVTAVSLVSLVLTYVAVAGLFVVLLGGDVARETLTGAGGASSLDPTATPFGTAADPFANVDAPSGGEIGVAVVLGLLLAVASAYLGAVSYASVAQQVGSIVAGEQPQTFGAAVRAAAIAGLRALPVWIAVILAMFVGFVALAFAIGVVAAILPVAGAILVGLLIALAALAGALYLVVRLCLFPAVFAIEGRGFASLRRSWVLTSGNVGRMSLVVLVAVGLYIAVTIGASIVVTPVQLLGASDETLALVLTLVVVLPVTLLTGVLALVALIAPLTIAYLRLRAATEGGDLALAARRFSQSAGPDAAQPQGWGADAGAAADRPAWDFAGGAADGSWVSRHSPPPEARAAPAAPADEDAERERFGRD